MLFNQKIDNELTAPRTSIYWGARITSRSISWGLFLAVVIILFLGGPFTWKFGTATSAIAQVSCVTAGRLDPTFGVGGVAATQIPTAPPYGGGFDVEGALQSDGKIVTVGPTGGNAVPDFFVSRHNSDGTLDSTFGNQGFAITDFFGANDTASSVVIQPDGKILVAGTAYNNAGGADFALARYNVNGTLDSSFGSSGKVTTSLFNLDIARSVALDSNGRIVVAGSSISTGFYVVSLVRYNTDGSLDVTFDADGKVTTNIFGGNSNSDAYAVAIQSDGRTIVVGDANVPGIISDFGVLRYNSNGSLDTTFDNDGKVTTDFASSGDFARSVVLQQDGKIVVAGTANPGQAFALARYNTNGSLDSSFDGDGKVVTNFLPSIEEFTNTVSIQPDGKIIAAGRVLPSVGNTDFAIARYLPDGALDPQFDGDGMLTTNIDGLAEIEAAFWSAVLVTFAGSMTPAATRSS